MGELMNRILEWLLGFGPGAFGGADGWEVAFVAEYGSYMRLGMLLAFAAMIYLTVRSYRREGDAPLRAKAVLATLRIAVIVLVFLVLLRPAVVLRFVKELRSTVVVLVDDSLSMGFDDPYAADGLRDELAASLEVDPDELTQMSRLEVACAMLARPGGVIDSLAVDHPLMLMAFSTDSAAEQYTRPMGTIDAEADPTDDASPAELATKAMAESLAASGFETDISRAVRDVLDRTRGRRVAGVVLVSDGQITTDGGDARLQAALDLANQRPVPLYAVMVGDPTPRKNLAVTSLDSPDQARRQSTVEMTATLAHRQLDGEQVTLRLMRRRADVDDDVWQQVLDAEDMPIEEVITLGRNEDGDTPPADGMADVTSAEGASVRTVTITFQPREIGDFAYRVEADVHPDEENRDDNASQPVAIRVTDERINVLVVSGDASWEFQYLKNFLYRDSDSYRVSVWQQNADEEINQAGSTGMKLTKLPRTLAELLGRPGDADAPGYQVVILLDPQPTEGGFDGVFAKVLAEFVGRGGGVCYVAGNKYSDTILLNPGPYEPLAKMLPVTLSSNTASDIARIREDRPQPWQARLTSYGVDHQVMRLGGSAEETKGAWGALPGVYWSHPVYQVKPGARVLAEHSNPLRRTGRDAAEPLVAVHSPDAGRALYVGTNGTWRWRFVRDGYYHRRFWANVIRFLAGSGASKRITVTAGGERFTAGEPITVEVEAYEEGGGPVRAGTFDITMLDLDSGDGQTITLTPVDPDSPGGHFSGVISEEATAHSGRFRLTVRGEGPDFEDSVAFKDIIIELPQDESRRKEANETTMRLIGSRASAAGPDGNFLHLHDIDRLAEMIPPGRRTTVHKQPRELWDSKLTLLLIVGLLAAEWITRKAYNMA